MGVDVLRTYEPSRIIFSSELKTPANLRGHQSHIRKRKSVLEAWERVVSTSGTRAGVREKVDKQSISG